MLQAGAWLPVDMGKSGTPSFNLPSLNPGISSVFLPVCVCVCMYVCVLACSGEANKGGSDQKAAEREEERSGGGEPGGSGAAEEAQRVHGQVHLP